MKAFLRRAFCVFVFFAAANAVYAEILRVFSFNIQVFGKAKTSKPDVVSILADIVQFADVMAIQEVRTADMDPIYRFMQMLPQRYSYVIGPREGRGSSKEQFLFIYDTQKLQVEDADTYPDAEGTFERRPFAVLFKTRSRFDFVMLTTHIQPRSAFREISALPKAVNYFRHIWGEKDVILAGDFNADGQYYNEEYLESVFPSSQFHIVISNEYDTNVAGSSATYDRIVITNEALEDYTGKAGVLYFDQLYNFEQYSIRPRDISDHYPIWAEFRTDADTD